MYNINAALGTQTVQKPESGNKNNFQAGGITFAEAVAEAVQLGKIVVPNKAETAEIDFDRNKFLEFEEVSWFGDEEEKIKQFIVRINRIIEQTKNH